MATNRARLDVVEVAEVAEEDHRRRAAPRALGTRKGGEVDAVGNHRSVGKARRAIRSASETTEEESAPAAWAIS